MCSSLTGSNIQVLITNMNGAIMLKDRLKTARESLGKSQKEMAEALDVGLKSWQVYEKGGSVPGGSVFEALTKLGFNANWLLTGSGDMWIDARMMVCEPTAIYNRNSGHPAGATPPQTKKEALAMVGTSDDGTAAGVQFFIDLAKSKLAGKTPDEIADIIEEMREVISKQEARKIEKAPE